MTEAETRDVKLTGDVSTDDVDDLDDLCKILHDELNQSGLPTNSQLHLECDDDETNDILLSQQIRALRREEEFDNVGGYIDIPAGDSSIYRIKFPRTDTTNVPSRQTCGRCGKTLPRLSMLLDHMATVHHVSDLFKCHLCNYSGQRYKHLYKHMKRMHPHDDILLGGGHSAEQTNSTVVPLESVPPVPIQSHVRTNNLSSEHQDIQVTDRSDIIVTEGNVVTVQSSPTILSPTGEHSTSATATGNIHMCTVCHKVYAKKRSLMYHKRTHLDKLHKCTITHCDKSFKTVSALNEHTATVHGDRSHMCPHEGCTKAYAFKRDLDYHIRVHGELFTCSVESCQKTFRDKYNLNLHVKTHSGQRDVKCEHCQYSCIQPSVLKLHKQRKHKHLINHGSNQPQS